MKHIIIFLILQFGFLFSLQPQNPASLDANEAALSSLHLEESVSTVRIFPDVKTSIGQASSSSNRDWLSIIITIILGLTGVLATLYVPFHSIIHSKINKLFRVHYAYSAGIINEIIAKSIAKNTIINLEDTVQLRGKFIYDFYRRFEMRVMTIRDLNGQIQSINIPYQEIINFINTPKVFIKISPRIMGKASLSDGDALIKSLLRKNELVIATKPIEDFVREKKPNTFNGAHPRLKSLTQNPDGSYNCSFDKTCYFAQIRTNLSLDYPITIDGHDTTLREIEMRRGNTLPSFEESQLANVIGVSAIWCMDGPGDKANDSQSRRFFLLPRVNNVGVYANRLGCPAGDIECPANGIFHTNSLVDYLKWEIAREFFEETGVKNDKYNPEVFREIVEPEYLDRNSKQIEAMETKFNRMIEKSITCERMEIIPLAFLRELLRGGKPMMFFLIRTEWIDDRELNDSFHKSMGKLEFKKKFISSAILSTETTCNYLYAQAYLQNKPKPYDCIDLSRGSDFDF